MNKITVENPNLNSLSCGSSLLIIWFSFVSNVKANVRIPNLTWMSIHLLTNEFLNDQLPSYFKYPKASYFPKRPLFSQTVRLLIVPPAFKSRIGHRLLSFEQMPALLLRVRQSPTQSSEALNALQDSF